MKSIHFICRGNVYRSRMAEAYAKSLQLDGIEFSSSGIEASNALNGDVDPAAVEALKADGITLYLKPKWEQTTQKDIDSHDVLVLMSPSLYEHARKLFDLPKHKIRAWNVQDVDGVYPQIKQEVDKLIKEIRL